jgi:hypothetical protein
VLLKDLDSMRPLSFRCELDGALCGCLVGIVLTKATLDPARDIKHLQRRLYLVEAGNLV